MSRADLAASRSRGQGHGNRFGSLKAGIGEDRNENILERLSGGEADGLAGIDIINYTLITGRIEEREQLSSLYLQWISDRVMGLINEQEHAWTQDVLHIDHTRCFFIDIER